MIRLIGKSLQSTDENQKNIEGNSIYIIPIRTLLWHLLLATARDEILYEINLLFGPEWKLKKEQKRTTKLT